MQHKHKPTDLQNSEEKPGAIGAMWKTVLVGAVS